MATTVRSRRSNCCRPDQSEYCSRTQLDKVASDQTKGDQDRQLAHHKLLVAETDLQSLKLRYAIELARLESNNNGSTNSAAIELLLDAAREQERLWVKYSAEVVVLEKQAALKTAEASEAKDEAKRNANIEKAKKELADAETKLARHRKQSSTDKAICDQSVRRIPIIPQADAPHSHAGSPIPRIH